MRCWRTALTITVLQANPGNLETLERHTSGRHCCGHFLTIDAGGILNVSAEDKSTGKFKRSYHVGENDYQNNSKIIFYLQSHKQKNTGKKIVFGVGNQ